MKTATRKLTRQQLAELAARAMNLLNHVRTMTDEGSFAPDMRSENEFHELAALLPTEDVRGSFWNNGSIRADEM